MRLGLSSAAGPGLSFDELLDACGRRGLAALELVSGHGHGVDAGAGAAALASLLPRAEERGIRLAALAHAGVDPARAEATLLLAARLGVPALLPVAGFVPADLCALVKVSARAEGRVLLLHGTDPPVVRLLRRAVERLPGGAAALACEIDPAAADPANVPAVLRHAGPWLRYVRFRGGGPDAAAQAGLGVGALMGRLALARYAGPLVLAPGANASAAAWLHWLGRRGGWGCGSRESAGPLVTLTHREKQPIQGAPPA